MCHYSAKAVKSWWASFIFLFAFGAENLEPNIPDIGGPSDFFVRNKSLFIYVTPL